jgi:hypothetical protein
MTRLVAALTFAGLSLSGCVVASRPAHHHHRTEKVVVREAPSCRPSHHWDGEKCRHNGKGKGARKHDY